MDNVLQSLAMSLVQFLPRLIVALLTFAAALLLAGPAARAVRRGLAWRMSNEQLLNALAKVTRWAVVTAGIVVALEQVNFNITGFLAGLGVAGLTIGFALQDITRNFVAGVLLMIRQPFVVGESVTAGGFSGTVEAITTRDTVIRTWDGELVTIPNTKVFEAPISNFTRSRKRMRTIKLGLSYEHDAERALELLRDAIRSVDGVLDEPAPSVWAESLGYSTMEITARFWVDTQAGDVLKVHSDAVLALERAAERAKD